MLAILLAATMLASGSPAPSAAAADPERGTTASPSFEASSRAIEGRLARRIEGSSWRPGCPVALRKLRFLRITHWGFDRRPHRGRLVVHRRYDDEIIAVMKRLFRVRYPIRSMKLIDHYGADDRRSMVADNTSAFNCRVVAGTDRWSMHAYGLAIDINPIENPYVSGSHVSPPAGAPYADRSRDAKGMIHVGDEVVKAFRKKADWGWLGAGPGSIRDPQHFSSTGH